MNHVLVPIAFLLNPVQVDSCILSSRLCCNSFDYFLHRYFTLDVVRSHVLLIVFLLNPMQVNSRADKTVHLTVNYMIVPIAFQLHPVQVDARDNKTPVHATVN